MKRNLLYRRNSGNSTTDGRSILDLSGGSSKKPKSVTLHVKKEVLTDKLIARREGDGINQVEEALELLSTGRKFLKRIDFVSFVRKREPFRAVNNQIAMIPAECN